MKVIRMDKMHGGESTTKIFETGEELFCEGQTAHSLYIIQKGQLRLFRPKGQGFIEIGILRAGEVLGEMAYFDKKAFKRSCSAQAMMPTEVVEVPFGVIDKIVEAANPWIVTIAKTLSDRLRKANEKVKQLEFNSVSYGHDGKVAEYKFFTNIDILRMLSVIYFTAKTSGEEQEGGSILIHFNIFRYYLVDIFNVQEVKIEEFLILLKEEGHLQILKDEDGLLRLIRIPRVESFRTIVNFIDTQRKLETTKQINISQKCEAILREIELQIISEGGSGEEVKVDLLSIIEESQYAETPLTGDDLHEAVEAKICGDIFIDDNKKLSCIINYDLLSKIFPAIRLQNLIRSVNAKKTKRKF